MAADRENEAKLQLFLQWLQVNGVELRCCTIKSCGPEKGFGVFTSCSPSEDGVAMVVPLDLSITPMRVLQDPSVGPRCRAMLEEGDVDDRFLMILFLTVERLRPNSLWKPYFDMLPNTFGSPLWFTEDEFAELKGTTLHKASVLQRKNLQALYDDKVKVSIKSYKDSLIFIISQIIPSSYILAGQVNITCTVVGSLATQNEEEKDYNASIFSILREVQFEDFLWAFSIFWTRALNIPFPRSYVFPEPAGDQSNNRVLHTSYCVSPETDMAGEASADTSRDQSNNRVLHTSYCVAPETDTAGEASDDTNGERYRDSGILFDKENSTETSTSKAGETVWVEGLVPGIDFCNHGLKPAATWEVDQIGSMTGIPYSMYLQLAVPGSMEIDKEVSISYGNKGNEELLYLYGFIIDVNPSDYLMVHCPLELLQNAPLSENKEKLLELQCLQKAELRSLLPSSLLDNGFFTGCHKNEDSTRSSFSWSGQRKFPSYLHKLVFPQEFMAALRTITMKENEIKKATSLLEELVGSIDEGQASEADVRAAVWESCGDYAALELLVDLLRAKMTELEESSGTLESDSKLLEDFYNLELEEYM
ncbi:uncharacterized protein LOC110032355, partial [Phalaenopsis equestris]|uniref:uncharacterized protein LOC110032355 n=1 Tax=Phalaenopsis equestris TaxID=78828 RepID=UPI0009E3D84D